MVRTCNGTPHAFRRLPNLLLLPQCLWTEGEGIALSSHFPIPARPDRYLHPDVVSCHNPDYRNLHFLCLTLCVRQLVR
ncbi:hypothetical protein CPAR01_10765 [Colletotrichum paranaense]|uniref:Uncharacterized protein n=3 Tax=Colletotrichum acutatum species complex TaxID=2707335 RepID=A0AAI9YGH4_9PEZI|nr:uncharacterized protein CCOS01_16128 [Colletotrichum costaricense]XP_060345373.1 uncharacterized protein CPAR01_10765 [Colletotrichum paranaense]XP_060386312.1 uncharacterized protein CTAM01_03277 [Colletotrichum tamarilloi]XP_060390720.1 uncharacterized protein CABS01_16000 [Colletotrichum abscissum]KAK1474021.1 hypothetical protein CABS01_16000 [Colletotrichum abscissum]KAK1506945.1 hypothetical protein CTAM01_03277 [Colletotrichum tamarilloi]KAK1508127.1 hypothetical protein CCOS01_1612